MTVPDRIDVVIVGAGAAGIGTAVALSKLDLEFVVLERAEIGASFRRWPDEMRVITPSFPSNSFGLTDLNAVTPNTSPAVTLDRQHPNGEEYAHYLESVAGFFELPVVTGVDVTAIRPVGNSSAAVGEHGESSTSTDDNSDPVTSNASDDAPPHPATHAPKHGVAAVDGGVPDESSDDGDPPDIASADSFVLETSDGVVRSEYVVWAGGQFGSPRRDVFTSADLCVHTSEVESWIDHATSSSTDEFLIVGGYESGIDAAVGLVEAGCSVSVLDRGEPWITRGPDPSEVLSPYTLGRLREIVETDRLQVEGGAVVEEVRRNADGSFEVLARPADGYQLTTENDADGSATYTVPTRPVLATGFESALGPVEEYFPRDDGTIQLTDRDESPTTPGLFLAGPDVTHNGIKFCFIYKFRTRFPVIAETIADRLGVDTDPLEEYRTQNMFLEDLACCEPDMCDC